MTERENIEADADGAIYRSQKLDYAFPNRRMTAGESQELVRMFDAIPSKYGFAISKVIDMSHAPEMFGGYAAEIFIDGIGRGKSVANNPAVAFRTAWARAHTDVAEKLTYCIHDWKEAITVPNGEPWNHTDRFQFCPKCRLTRDAK